MTIRSGPTYGGLHQGSRNRDPICPEFNVYIPCWCGVKVFSEILDPNRSGKRLKGEMSSPLFLRIASGRDFMVALGGLK